MYFPTLNELPTSRKTVDVFGGYNHNLRIGDGEFFEMENMTSDHYPVLAPRGKRGLYKQPELATGLIAKEKLCYTDGSCFVMGDERIEMGLSLEPKQLVSMGAYVIILPDRKYINTMDPEDRGDIEASYESIGEVTFTLCTASGAAYPDAAVGDTAPENPEDQALWIDSSKSPHVLMRFSQATGMWASVAATYVKISATGIGQGFKPYDGVTISGIVEPGLESLNGTVLVQDCGDDYILVGGIVDQAVTQSADAGIVTVERQMPEMDFVIESGNRLWGCRYGLSREGEMVNEIYASKLGDFRNWRCYMGISTDSYTASCGTDGPFTGAITHGGRPLFFKENHLHKVFGSVPANFQIQATACRGVQNGSHRSLAIVNETLFYKSRGGICAYDGSLPVEASPVLGNESYKNAVAGAIGNKYYISMADMEGVYHLFVYDTAKGMWHREDHFRAVAFAAHQGDLYAIDGADGAILAMLGSGEEEEKKLHWLVQTGPMGTDSPDTKYISKLLIRMSLGLGSRVRFLAQYDSMGAWHHLGTIVGTNLKTFSLPIKPVRCDHLRLRIDGEGDCRIYSITRTIEKGSDVS